MEEKILEILSKVLKKNQNEIKEIDSQSVEKYWDSLQMIEIVFCLEQDFNVSIDTADIPSLKSIKSISEIINKARQTQ
jgi:acyl carrier protein